MPDDQLQLFGGDWTDGKLRILERYLHDYNQALKNQPFTRFYVDAFAGTGYRQQPRKSLGTPSIFQDIDEQTHDFLKGSAKRALEVKPPFHRYIFIESDPKKVAELERLGKVHEEKGNAIQVIQGDGNAYVRRFCKEMAPMDRAVVFLDPFATEMEWQTVEEIAASKKIDVWIWFPLMAVNRLLASDPREEWRKPLDRVFGTQKWFERFYRTRVEKSIFGRSFEVVDKACDSEGVGAFFLERLLDIFPGVAPRPRVFRNRKNAPLFQLFFAAGNEKGAPIALRIANHLLERI